MLPHAFEGRGDQTRATRVRTRRQTIGTVLDRVAAVLARGSKSNRILGSRLIVQLAGARALTSDEVSSLDDQ